MSNVNLRLSKYGYFMDIASVVAKRSPCLSRQVGCVLIDQYHHIKATGYNGPPSGIDHCTTCHRQESGRDLYKCNAVHAEMNALMQCADVNQVTVMFITINPCEICLRMLMNTGIKTIFCAAEYTHESAVSARMTWESKPGRRLVIGTDDIPGLIYAFNRGLL